MPREKGETSEKTLGIIFGEGIRTEIIQYFPTLRVEFTADGDIDADGSPRAYHPQSGLGLDYLANAGYAGNWWGIETDRNGVPFIQGPDDPAPGFYVSGTAYARSQFPKSDPRRFLDSETVPFIVVQGLIRRQAKGIVLGCRARVTNKENGKSVECIVGDTGPSKKIGELSIAAAKAIGLPWNPRRNGGTEKPILKYELWPGQVPLLAEKFLLIPMRIA